MSTKNDFVPLHLRQPLKLSDSNITKISDEKSIDENVYKFGSKLQLTHKRGGLYMDVLDSHETPVQFQLDTGASTSICNIKHLQNFTIIKKLPHSNLKSYTNDLINTELRALVRLFIPSYGYVHLDISFVSNYNTNLLGLNFFKKCKSSLLNISNKFYITFERSYIRKSNYLKLLNNLTLPSKYSRIMNVKLTTTNPKLYSINQEMFIQPTENVLPQLVKVSGVCKNTVTVDIAFNNVHEKPITLKRNMKFHVVLNVKALHNAPLTKTFLPHILDVDEDTLAMMNETLPIFSNHKKGGDTGAKNVFNINETSENATETDVPLGNKLILDTLPRPSLTTEERKKIIYNKIEMKKYEPKLEQLLKKHFMTFAAFDYDCGATHEMFNFNFDPNYQRNRKIYPLSSDKLKSLQETLDNLIFNDLIEKAPNDTHGSPVFLVHYKNRSSYRLIIDARSVNKAIVSGSNCVMESCHSIIERISKSKWISCCDLEKAYYSMKCSKELLESGLQNILTPIGCFRIKALITGSSITPVLLYEYLQKYLNSDVDGNYDPLRLSQILAFYDDINLVSGHEISYDTYLSELSIFLNRIQRSGFRISLDKSTFGLNLDEQEIEVLGFVLGKGSIKPIPRKLEAIKEQKMPTTLKGLQTLIGSLQYFRHILKPNIGGAIAIMSNYASATKFKIDQTYKNTFKHIMNQLYNLEIFIPQNNSINFLFTDSSLTTMGGVMFNVPSTHLYPKKSMFKPQKILEMKDSLKNFLNKFKEPWIKNLQLIYSNNDLLKILYDFSILTEIHTGSLNDFEHLIHQKIFLLGAYNKLKIPEFVNPKDFFSNVTLIPKGTYKVPENMLVYYENQILSAFSEIAQRQILFLTEKNKYFFLGMPSHKSPLILYFKQEENKFYNFISTEKFLHFDKSLLKYIENLNTESVVETFLKKLNDKNVCLDMKPVGYFTKKFNNSYANKPIFLKEMESIFQNLLFFRPFLKLTKTVLLSDNLPSVQLLRKPFTKDVRTYSLIARIINEFSDVPIVYIKGSKNLSDVFSRAYDSERNNKSSDEINAKFCLPQEINGEWCFFQSFKNYLNYKNEEREKDLNPKEKNDIDKSADKQQIIKSTDINMIKNQKTENCVLDRQINGGKTTTKYINILSNDLEQTNMYFAEILSLENFSKSYSIEEKAKFEKQGNLLYLQDKIVVPEKLYYILIAKTHRELSHGSENRLYKFMNKFYAFIPNKMKSAIKTYTAACLPCALTKPNRLNLKEGTAFDNISKPYEFFSADIGTFDMVPMSANNLYCQHFLIVICHYTYNIHIQLLSSKKDSEMTKALSSIFCNFGVPSKLLTDNGQEFYGPGIKKLLKILGVYRINSSPYVSKARSVVERAIGSIRELLRLILIENPTLSAPFALTIATKLFNCTPKESLNNLSPNQILFNNQAFLYPYIMNKSKLPNLRKIRTKINESIKETYNNVMEGRKKRQIKRNKKRSTMNLEINDLIVTKKHALSKTQPLFGTVIYRVIQIFDYTVECERLYDLAIQIKHKREIKKIYNSDGKINIPKEIRDKLGLITLDPNTLDLEDQIKKSKIEEGIVTRSRSKSSDNETSVNMDNIIDNDLDYDLLGLRKTNLNLYPKKVRFDL